MAAPPSRVRGGPVFPAGPQLRRELTNALVELSACGLLFSAQWAAELHMALPKEEGSDHPVPDQTFFGPAHLYGPYMLAKAHFGMREYSRASQALQNIPDLAQNQAALFIRFYSMYLAGEKRKEEEIVEVYQPGEKCIVKNNELKEIEELMAALYEHKLLNGLNLYLYGVVVRGLGLEAQARDILLESLRLFPCNWSAWLDLIALSSDDGEDPAAPASADLPDHWMAWFYRAASYVEWQRNEEAREMYCAVRRHFPNSSHILSQLATCEYNTRNFDVSQALFEEIRQRDPYMLGSMDTYSNILYVKEQSVALSLLARSAISVDKYTPETCCIIGNYYSLKGEHEKSVMYFQRALLLNRNFTPAWILMGHEYMEIKNTPLAIDAYRTAVNITPRDYRAWYGLGQTYELLNLHFYALFYYKRAMALRPDDARMWCAMAQCYGHIGRKLEALKCYEKAHLFGDRERMALPMLARLNQESGDRRAAAAYYCQILMAASGAKSSGPSDEDASTALLSTSAEKVSQHGACDDVVESGICGSICWDDVVCPPALPPRTSVAASGGSLPSEAVEALRFLMLYFRDEGRFADSEICATQLLDTAGPEKDEAKTLLLELRAQEEFKGERKTSRRFQRGYRSDGSD